MKKQLHTKKNIKVVIGANFGDEGKGLVTDYLCANAKGSTLVVLTNGGAQRGHTVNFNDQIKHTFHAYSSGSFRGVDDHFGPSFILNPMSFAHERGQIDQILKGLDHQKKRAFIHSKCRWSTPYDVIVNQIVETSREEKNHGSCGMGIWETVVRYQTNYKMDILDYYRLGYPEKVNFLKYVRDNYFSERLKLYGIKNIPEDWKRIWYSPQLVENFIKDFVFMVETSRIVFSTEELFSNYDNIIFENGQGLLLDQNNKFYGPDFTTPSDTGCKTAASILMGTTLLNKSKADDINVELCYVSRTYMTRHGKGLFITETNKNSINPDMVDENNPTNEFQGKLRYGELELSQLVTRVQNDSSIFSETKNLQTSLFLTHMNEFNKVDIGFIKDKGLNVYTSDTKFSDSVKKVGD